MPLQVTRVGQDTKPQLNLLVYGIPGVGKTTFAAQAQDHPDLSPVLIADLEGGLLSVTSRGDIDSVQIRSSDDLEELFWMLRNRHEGFDKYKTVVIDSGTNFSNRVLEEWVARNSDRANKRGRGDKDRTIDDVQIEDYGKMGKEVSRVLGWYRDLPVNLIVTALARFTYAQGADSRSAEPIDVGPDFTQGLARSITGMMDHVWYLYVDDEGKRHLLTQKRGVYMAKTRGQNFNPALGFHVDEPKLSDIYQLLLESETGEPVHVDPNPPDVPYLHTVDEDADEVLNLDPEGTTPEEQAEADSGYQNTKF